MLTSILAFVLAFLKALPEICKVVTAIGNHLKELDIEHNEKTSNERLAIKKKATQDFINAANVAANPQQLQQSSSGTSTVQQQSEDKGTVS